MTKQRARAQAILGDALLDLDTGKVSTKNVRALVTLMAEEDDKSMGPELRQQVRGALTALRQLRNQVDRAKRLVDGAAEALNR